MAHLKTKITTKDHISREQWKWHIVRGLYEKGYNRNNILQLFRLIDWMMTLPDDLQLQFENKVDQYQEESKMPVLSNIEFRALNRGRQEGRQEGKLLNSRESILEILETRFGGLPQDLQNTINQIEDIAQLKTLIKQAVTIPSVSDFQRLLN